MRKILLLASVLLLSVQAWAVPAYPFTRTVRQSDGTEIVIRHAGDEHLAYFVTSDGCPVVQNSIGDWCYAEMKEGRLVAGGMIAHEVAERSEDEKSFISTRSFDVSGLTHKTPLRLPDRLPLPRRTDLSGQKRGLIILAEFPDVRFSVADPAATFQKIANGDNYKENGFFGSVRDYFRDQSRGTFDFTFDVKGPVTLPMPMEYYGKDSLGIIDYHGPDLAVHACKAVDHEVNFRDYDWDGDKEADMIFIIFAGYGQNYGAPANTIWPFKGYASHSGYEPDREFTYLDDTLIDVFACSCELFGTTGTTLNGIGTLCHEFSHCFDLKDHYGTGGTGTHPMGYWDIMDYGSYNDQARRPVAYTAFERMFCGWLDPVELVRPSSVRDMKPITQGGETYVIYNDGWRDECFFIENRFQEGWDEFLPNSGILVTHLDYFDISWKNNTVNTILLHPRYAVVPADGKNGMSDADQEGDTFPYLDYIAGVYNNFLTDVSSPSTVLFNSNADGSTRLGKPVTNMDVKGDGLASFDFLGGGDPPEAGVSMQESGEEGAVEIFGIDGMPLGSYSSVGEAAGSLRGRVVIVRRSSGNVEKALFR